MDASTTPTISPAATDGKITPADLTQGEAFWSSLSDEQKLEAVYQRVRGPTAAVSGGKEFDLVLRDQDLAVEVDRYYATPAGTGDLRDAFDTANTVLVDKVFQRKERARLDQLGAKSPESKA